MCPFSCLLSKHVSGRDGGNFRGLKKDIVNACLFKIFHGYLPVKKYGNKNVDPMPHPILSFVCATALTRQGWLADLKLSNCVSAERELSIRGYHRVPVNIHHRHSLHVLEEHHSGESNDGYAMCTYLWYRRMAGT